MPTKTEVTATSTLKTETVTKTVTVMMQTTVITTIKETITKTLENFYQQTKTTETIEKEPTVQQPQTFKWRLLWERRLNGTLYELKVSPSGNFVSVLAGL